jgi:hypothetical protein
VRLERLKAPENNKAPEAGRVTTVRFWLAAGWMVQLRASSHQRHSLAGAARHTQGHLEAPFGTLGTLEHDQLADGDALWRRGC